jgi:hypothetical protein
MNSLHKTILEAASGLGFGDGAFIHIPSTEAEALTVKMLGRFIDNPNRVWWWEGLIGPAASLPSFSEASSMLGGILVNPEEELFLFTTPDDSPEIHVFKGSAKVLCAVIDGSPFFEYALLHPSFDWVLIESHHNQLFGSGHGIISRFPTPCA